MNEPTFFNSRGFTLVEVLIAIGILAAIAFGISEMLVGTLRKESEIKLKQDVFNFQQQIRYENRIMPLPSSVP